MIDVEMTDNNWHGNDLRVENWRGYDWCGRDWRVSDWCSERWFLTLTGVSTTGVETLTEAPTELTDVGFTAGEITGRAGGVSTEIKLNTWAGWNWNTTIDRWNFVRQIWSNLKQTRTATNRLIETYVQEVKRMQNENKTSVTTTAGWSRAYGLRDDGVENWTAARQVTVQYQLQDRQSYRLTPTTTPTTTHCNTHCHTVYNTTKTTVDYNSHYNNNWQ